MNEQQFARLLRDLATALEDQAGPGRGPRAPQRPGGPDEDEIARIVMRVTAAGYRKLADGIEAAGLRSGHGTQPDMNAQ